MPGLARPGSNPGGGMPPHTRRQRAQHLLGLPDEVLRALTCIAGMQEALASFIPPVCVGNAYDAVAFVYGFGIEGPTASAWRGLFTVAEGMRGEEIAVCVGICAIRGLEEKGRRSLLEEVVMGTEEVPGILSRVCDGFDDWLVSTEALMVPITTEAEDVARRWRLERLGDGRFVWVCEGRMGVGVFEEHRLGDASGACAWRIGVEVTKRVLEGAMKRVSWEGMGDCLRRVRERAYILADGGKCKAEGVLINRVFEALGVRQPDD
eukprot:GFKZ01004523.1.p1 GENE.GFKZ01004523.1~~GFKZ01004523.1.p1  ORF type:complete len:264 (+),score=28.17 GFKZ01004523.1:549-1340(+)